jgi:acetyl/propionyl-CoA carboxylase alpha subunit
MMRLTAQLDGGTHPVALLRHGPGGHVWIGETGHEATISVDASGETVLVLDGKAYRLWIASHGETAWLHAFGRDWQVSLLDPVKQASAGHDESDLAVAPMPGTVVEIAVKVGEAVTRGQVLLVIESMKMQTTLTAGRDGTVAELPVAPGEAFNRGALLARLAAGEG